jgi:hypothetical protein
MIWFCCWLIALSSEEGLSGEPTDLMKPAGWSSNFWGPAATRARSAGQLPPLPINPAMARSRRWGGSVLREGDIVFRLGDARILRGSFPLSWFIAKATGSQFSHTGIVAIEEGSPVVYDCSSDGIQRQPFEVWMLDCVGAFGVKRLKPAEHHHIPGVIEYCRKVFERQVPFDFEFRDDDAAFYCLELTEKAFRSQGLALSQPVRIGDWQNLTKYPLTALAIPSFSGLVVERPITLEQPVFLPGDERHGVWSSPLLETVFGPESKSEREAPVGQAGGLSVRGDIGLLVFTAAELHRSYSELPVRWTCRLALHPKVQELIAAGGPSARETSLNN